jgi:hypothetical protein
MKNKFINGLIVGLLLSVILFIVYFVIKNNDATIIFNENSFVSNDVVDYKYSPDGKYIALSYIRSAGATDSYSIHTSIYDLKNKNIVESGNVFIGNKATFVNIHWKERNTLIIEHATDEENISKKEELFGNIIIEYITNFENKIYYGNSIDYKIPKGIYIDLPRDKYGWVIYEQ